nr:cyclin-b1-5 [Quercus suber]
MVAIVALVIASKFEERQFPSALTLMEDGVSNSCGYFDREFKNMAFFFGEVALNDYHATISYSPSTLAVSAIYAAMCVLKKSHGSKQIFLNTNQSHSKGEVTLCAGMLQRLASMAPTGKLMRTLAEKYSDQILILHSKK